MNSTEKKIDAKLLLSIIAAGMMSFSGVVVETAMNVTFPTLMQEFSISTSTVQWITTGYLLVLAIIIPTSSYLKRRFTTKSLFVTAITLFILGTILCAVAPHFSLLLTGRLIQGIGTGIALPLMFNIVLEQVPEDKLGAMMGVASLITSLAPAVGPSIGGLIVHYFGWRMVFVALLPFLILSFLFGVFSIRQVTKTEKSPFQWIDYLFLAAGFACFIFATSTASSAGWGSVQVIGLFAASALTLFIFYRRSARSAHPLIHVAVFHCPPFVFSVLALIFIQFVCLGLGFLIPNFAQIVSGENAFISGCLLLPGCLLGAILSPFSGRILDRFGAKRPIFLGNALILFAAVCFGLFATRMAIGLIALVYVFFALGQGFCVGNTMTNGIRQLPANLNTDGNAVNNTMQQLSGAIGTSVVTSIVAASQAHFPNDLASATIHGSQNAYLLLAGVAVLLLCCSIVVFATIRSTAVKEAAMQN